MKTIKIITPLILLTFMLAGCGNVTPAALPTPTPTYIPFILLPTQEPTVQLPTITPQPGPTATSRPFDAIKATVNVENLKLRKGPGFMFDTVRTYDIGELVAILMREPGNNWVLVQTADNRSGWMNVNYLSFTEDMALLPVITVTGVQTIRGRVLRTDMAPATKIGVSIARVIDPGPDFQDQTMTNASGEWYLYLPLELRGDWVIGVNAYSPDSNAVDSSGNLVGGLPGAQKITLPLQADVSFEFALTK